MDYVIMRPRLVWRLLMGWGLGLGGLCWILFGGGFASLQAENGIFPYLAIPALIALFLIFACLYFIVTKDGLQRGLTLGYVINFSQNNVLFHGMIIKILEFGLFFLFMRLMLLKDFIRRK